MSSAVVWTHRIYLYRHVIFSYTLMYTGGVYSLLRNGLLRALREVQGDKAPPPPPSMASGRRGGAGKHVAPPVGMESFVLNVVAAGIATTVRTRVCPR